MTLEELTIIDLILSSIASIVTVSGIIIGLIYGRQKLNKLLKDDFTKATFQRINNSNFEIALIAERAIKKLKRRLEFIQGERVTNIFISDLKNIIQELHLPSIGSSTAVNTLITYLIDLVDSINEEEINLVRYDEDFIKKNNIRKAYISQAEVINFTIDVCYRISYISKNIIDTPRNTKTAPLFNYKKGLFDIDKNKIQALEGFNFKDIRNPTSAMTLHFSEKLNNWFSDPIIKKFFYVKTQSNIPEVNFLMSNKVYSPPLLISDTEDFIEKSFGLGRRKLSLIKTQIRVDNTFKDEKQRQIVRFYYANLNERFSFVDQMELNIAKLAEYNDFMLSVRYWPVNSIFNITKYGNEIFSFDISFNVVNERYSTLKWNIKEDYKKYKRFYLDEI